MKLNKIVVAIAALVVGAAQAATVRTTDYIASPSHFNGFEGLPDANEFEPSYTEDGITVRQINGEGNDIWTTYTWWGAEGERAWYPNGGDFGYTSISLQSGDEFEDISFLAGSGYSVLGGLTLYYELALDGSVVQSGSMAHSGAAYWLGFSGGGFDEVRLRDTYGFTSSLNDGQLNAFAIDSIKVAGVVPEPETYALMLAGLGVVGVAARRRRV